MRQRPTSSADSAVVWRVPVLICIVLLGAALRFYGLRWGLPNDLHDYSYHPDEFLTVGASFGHILAHRTFDPGLYNYPSVYLYLCAIAISAGLAYGVTATFANIYLMARTVTALMGTAAVAVTYWAGKVSFGGTAAIIAALVMCIAPIHVQHSHFATVDVPSTLFVAAALGFSGLILRDGSWKSYLLGGVMAGLAAGTKYNAALVLLSVIAAHLLRGGGWRTLGSGKLWAAVGCAVAAFVVSTPGSVLWPSAFMHGIGYELEHASKGHGLVFLGTGNGFLYTMTSSLWYGLGPQVILFLPAVILAFVKRSKPALMVLAFVIPYYILISVSQVRFARYALPLFPGVAILTGWFVVEVWSAVRSWNGRVVWAVECILILGWTLAWTLALTSLFSDPDPRDQAARWIKANIPKGASIGVTDVPWFYSPPLSKTLGFGTRIQREEAMRKTPYRIVLLKDGSLPEWAMTSDFEIRDANRLEHRRSIEDASRLEIERILSGLRVIGANHTFRFRRTFGGRADGTGFLGFPDPPHDMRYVQPKISIYEYKK